MIKTQKSKLPLWATFVGGPLDGEKVKRPTNRWAEHKKDNGSRMGAYTHEHHWKKPFRELRLPKSGYKLELDYRVGGGPGARYVHHSIWHQWMLGDDAEARAFHANDIATLKRHNLTPEDVDMDPNFAGYFVGEFERDSRGVDVATYLQERRLDYLAEGVNTDDDDGRDWFVTGAVPFRDWGTPQQQVARVDNQLSAAQARKLRVIYKRAPELAAEVELGRLSIDRAHHALVERDITERAAR